MQDCGNRGIEMWFCIGMYFFLGACAWMYFKKKSLFKKWDRLLRQIFFLMLAVTSLAFLSEIVQKTGTENSETMQIKRNGYGEGQKEAALSMQVEGEKKQDIEIRVSPKIYSEKRLEKEFQKARKELAKVISGENKDLSHIKTDLDLVTALDDFPFSVSWELSRYDVMDSLGRLDQEKIREEDPENQGIGMNITGVLHYEDKVYPCEMDLVIFAGQEKTLSTKERVLELVRLQDSATRQKAYLTLPPSLDGRKIAWTEEKDSKVIPILMLGMAISILLVGREIQKESNRKKTRKEQMMLDYPEIITEFTMLTGAGMTAKNVWKRIAEDYGITRGKTGRKREAYEEIWKTWQEMKSGIPEMECYERFARRCDLIPYMKMGALLSQNLKKGAKGISEMLRMEAVQALEDRKSRARQLGEEAGTRLLIPMLLMLIIVVEYEKMKIGAAAIENLTGKVSEWKEQELKANEYGKENIETSKELDQMLESEKEELPAENNPLADIVDIQAQALLNLVSPEGFTLSSKAVKSEETVSSRKLRQGYGTMKEKNNGAGDTIFFNLYLIDKFGNAANKKENTALDYEMEYLLGGKASDKDNLEYVIGRIRILRFAVNYGYLLTDKDMQMEVDTLATTLSAVFLSPEIGPVIKHALLLAWAYGESLTDVKTLLAGKKVPAVKSKESWNLTLDGLLELAKNRSIPEGKETEEGNSYEQYLQMMLVLKSKEELSMRALDLVEMNLRSGMEKTFFRADACVSGADFDMTCYLRRGIRYQYHILYQYQ